MMHKKRVLAIVGSTRKNSSNERLVKKIAELSNDIYEVEIFNRLAALPHFNPDIDHDNPLAEVTAFRERVVNADAVIICTPEYVFSLPGSFKNLLEWCVSTVIFCDKPVGLITAAASGVKGHEELQLVVKTLGGKFNEETTLLIPGVQAKFNTDGELADQETLNLLRNFLVAFQMQLSQTAS